MRTTRRRGGKRHDWRIGAAWRNAQTFASPEALPSRWDSLLRELRISEEHAVLAIRGLVDAPALAETLRGWVRSHYNRCFVPEIVTYSMGLYVDGFAFGNQQHGSGSSIAKARRYPSTTHD